MVDIDKKTDIFKLIRNKDSTVEDFRNLYDIAPEKFDQVDDEKNNIVDIALLSNREDLIDFLKTKSEYYKDEKNLEKLVLENLDNNNKKYIEAINFKLLKKETNENIVRKLVSKQPRDIEKCLYHLYLLFSNPKGEINLNIKIGGAPIIFMFTKSDSLASTRIFMKLIDKYKPELNLKGIDGNRTLLQNCIEQNNYTIAELLIEKGAKVDIMNDGYGYLERINNHIENLDERLEFFKLFLENGIDPDQPIKLIRNKSTLLCWSIYNNNKELFNLLLEKGADVNSIGENGSTPLTYSILLEDKYYIEKLIEKRADVNKLMKKSPALPLLFIAVDTMASIPIIELIIDSGANIYYKHKYSDEKEENIIEYVEKRYKKNKKYYTEVLRLLGGQVPDEVWKGFSRSDIEKFDAFFEKPYDWSCCPICLVYTQRDAGCMYMSHDCAITGNYYHKNLYDDFLKNEKIEWCTICGRITQDHAHFKLSQAQEPSKEKAVVKPEIQDRLGRGDYAAFFDNANCIGFGGGGLEEKAARFRRLREYALELQEDVGKSYQDDVMDELVEEVWNAPLVRNKKIKKILADKKWNINVKEFPEDKRNTRNNNNANNGNSANAANAPNVPFNGRKPTKKDGERCTICDEEVDVTNPVYQFHHETVGGMNHDGIYICQKDLARSIEIKCAEFGLEDFGKCWLIMCKGILHPEELKGIIPEVLYEDYRKKFNKKMARRGGGRRSTKKLKKQKQRGGNIKSMIHELKNGTCAPPNLRKNNKLK